jgi:hypothetical protein
MPFDGSVIVATEVIVTTETGDLLFDGGDVAEQVLRLLEEHLSGRCQRDPATGPSTALYEGEPGLVLKDGYLLRYSRLAQVKATCGAGERSFLSHDCE